MPTTTGGGLPSIRGTRVLVVDDDEDTREVTAAILQQHGAQVLTAGSTEEALDLLSEWTPDVVLADLAMPVEDGFGLIKKLRARETHARVRLAAAAFTSEAGEAAVSRALAAGFDLHLSKPVTAATLVAAIETLTSGKTST
ncbi:MAG: response regulator [Acidobacteria bacterium]|nr:response regulator [Acidobacteriota bacterium]